MPKYTEEQIERAKNVDVAAFLQATEGYTFEQSGHYLKCLKPKVTEQPSSLAIDLNMNRIFYNSVTGSRPLSAVDWCTQIKGMDFQSAMKTVIGENPNGERAERPKFKPVTPQVHIESGSKNFTLPESGTTHKHVYMYLTATRGIPRHIVNSCIEKGLITEDNRRNAVFVGYDDENKARYAARRGTYTPNGAEPFKRDVSGSDKNFAFKLVGKDTSTIYVAEAAIDALSLAAIEDRYNGEWSFTNKTYLSTGGAGIDSAIEQFIKTHDVKTINVCFDNDEAGRKGAEKIMQKYRAMGYEVNDMRATFAHDYNDELTELNKNSHFYPEPPKTVRNTHETERNGANMPEMNRPDVRQRNTSEMNENENLNNFQQPMPDMPNPFDGQNFVPFDDMDFVPPPPDGFFDYMNDVPIPDYEPPMNDYYDPVYAPEPPVNNQQYGQPTQQPVHAPEPPVNNQQYGQPTQQPVHAPEPPVNNQQFGQPTQQPVHAPEPPVNNQPFRQPTQQPVHAPEPPVNNQPVQQETSQTIVEEEKKPLPEEPEKKQSEVVINGDDEKKQSDIIIPPQTASTEVKMSGLLASMKDRQEGKRADILDKIEKIDGKIAARKDKIEKLNNKIADLETTNKTLTAFKRVFGKSAVANLIDNAIQRNQDRIDKIKDEKIPLQESKIKLQTEKKNKQLKRLAKVNKKIDRIDKVQNFITAIGSKDREVRHQGFVTGLENLSDFRRENLENRANNLSERIKSLTAELNSSNLSNKERHDIQAEIKALTEKNNDISDKIKSMDKLHQDLTDIKNGKFTVEEVDKTVDRTAEKLTQNFETSEHTEDKGILNNIINQSVKAGEEAIRETSKEKTMEIQQNNVPIHEQERTVNERTAEINQGFEQGILLAAAAITGVDISELNRIPAELKADIVNEFLTNNGKVSSEILAERICEIADIEPPKIVEPVRSEEKKEEQHEEQKKQLIFTIENEDDIFCFAADSNISPDNILRAAQGDRESLFGELSSIGQEISYDEYLNISESKNMTYSLEINLIANTVVMSDGDNSEKVHLSDKYLEHQSVDDLLGISERQAVFTIEQMDDMRYFQAGDLTLDEIMEIANGDNPYYNLMEIGKEISQNEYEQIYYSEKLTFAADLDFDAHEVSFEIVNEGKGGIAESDRNENNTTETRFTDISEYAKDSKKELTETLDSGKNHTSEKKPLFSMDRVKNGDFKPTSSKSQEDIDRDKQKHKNDLSF